MVWFLQLKNDESREHSENYKTYTKFEYESLLKLRKEEMQAFEDAKDLLYDFNRYASWLRTGT